MGEVYRARDTRLARDVAIKTLPGAFSADAERLRRFEQEARAAAALNHPNILAVFDIGTHDGAPYIVSELLDGETLRDRLRSALSVRKALDYAIQIAHGLAAAHDKAIVHRDLKPENLFVTADGHVKLLDFGLAKLMPDPQPGHLDSVLPTKTADTHPGVVFGTLGYMSPEQVRAQPVDHRSDIFSFGAILYEMLSGVRAFRAATTADTITAILEKAPADLPVVEHHIPPALERIVDRCLEKKPGARFQTATDLAFALEALSSHSDRSEAVAGKQPSSDRRASAGVAWAVAAISAIALIATLLLATRGYFEKQTGPAHSTRTTVLLPEGALYTAAGSPAYRMSISPDGTQLSYAVSLADSTLRLWVRPLDALDARPLDGTEQGGGGHTWSPDGRSIAYFTNPLTALRKVDVAGGPPQTLVELSGAGGAGVSWNKDNIILFSTNGSSAVRRVPASGGAADVVLEPDSTNGETALWYPSFLPDGNHFFFLAMGPLDGALKPLGIYVSSLDGSVRKLVMRGGSNMQFADGKLLFLRDRTLMAQPFDVDRLELTGAAAPVAEQVQIGGTTGATGAFVVSQNGVLAYIPGPALGAGVQAQLVWLDRTGKMLSTVGDRAAYSDLELSRDASHATVSIIEPARPYPDIWVVDLARGLRTKLTFDPNGEHISIWSPDGRRVIYSSTRTPPALYEKASDI
jgi:Tol biopolymer transport system component